MPAFHMQKKKTHKALQRYSSAAVAFLCTHATEAQAVYENIDPDIFGGYEFVQAIDINDDGVDDITFRVWQTSYSWSSTSDWSVYSIKVYVSAYNFDAVVGSADFPFEFNIKKLQLGDTIGSANLWNEADEVSIDNFFSTDDGYAHAMGGWIGSEDFIGVRFQIAGETHYGWIRLALDNFSLSPYSYPKLCILEKGYEMQPDTEISILPEAVDIAKNVTLQDIDETGTVADLEVAFDAALNESEIAEYRIFMHEGYSIPIETAEGLSARSSAYYQTVSPGALHYTVPITPFLDLSGATLQDSVYYTPIILSVPNGTGATQYNVSLPGNREDARIESAASLKYVYGTQVANTYTAADFKVTFGIYSGNQFTDHYEAFIVDTYAYDKAELLALPDDYHMDVMETGSMSYNVTFTPDKKIFNVDSPSIFGRYYFVVVSLPDTSIATNSKSLISSEDYEYYVDYFNPWFPLIPAVTLVDTTHTAGDIQVSCPHLDPENTIDHYSIYIVPAEDAALFNAETASGITSAERAYQVYPAGVDIRVTLQEGQTDIYGNSLIDSNAYVVFVGIETEGLYPRNSVSLASAPFTLNQPRETISSNIYTNGNELTIVLDTELPVHFHIASIDGRAVYNGTTQGFTTKITLEHLRTGIYVIQFPNTIIPAQKIFIKE